MSLGTLGRYRLIRKLAQGGMAEVFLAKSYGAHGFEKPVAIKKILQRFASDEQFVTMLIDEAKICSLLTHPNIVPVSDFHADGKDCYLVMEYVPGRSLSNLLRGLGAMGRTLSVEHLVYVIREIAAGLHHAHTKTDRAGQPLKIVHRDVSPQNILLSFEGYAKIIDFGIARARNRLARTEAGTLKGKIRYLAPEQVEGKEVDGRTDLFALGIVMWEALCNRALFDGDNDVQVIDQVVAARVPDPREYNKNVPEELARTVLKALQRNKASRHATAEAFSADLRGILARMNPDYDPSALGALLRTTFAGEIEEDTREETEAEAEIRELEAGPTLEEGTRKSEAPVDRSEERTLAEAARIIRGKSSLPDTQRAVPTAAAARKEVRGKGRRASEARRAAAEKNPTTAPAPAPAPPPHLHEPTLTGTDGPRDATREDNARFVLPVPSDFPTARPDEPTRAAYDTRTEPVRAPKGPTKGSAPKRLPPRPAAVVRRRSLTLLALTSAAVGAVLAVVLGLVVVSRLDANPGRLPGSATALPRETAPLPPPAVDVPTTTKSVPVEPTTQTSEPAPVRREVSFVTVRARPDGVKVLLDGKPAQSGQPLEVTPGKHRVQLSLDGHVPEERVVELLAGEGTDLDIRLAPVKSKAPERREERRPPPRKVERAPAPAKAQATLKLLTPGTWATITVDGEKLSEQAPAQVSVGAGSHTVVLTHGPSGKSRSFQVDLAPNEVRTLRAEF